MSLSPTDEEIFFIFDQVFTYLSFTILFLGLIGNLLNIFIFLHNKFFHKNHCIFYLIAESIVDCVQLLITFTSRIGIMVFQYDPMQSSLAWCKIRSMIAQACTLISMTSVCFAVIDQYLSTHPNSGIRKKSTLQLAQILMCINISIWLLHGIPFLLTFEIRSPIGCASFNLQFLRYYNFFHFPILIGFLPIIIGSIFSVLAYRNVRHIIQRRISHIQRRLDRQLTAIVLVRVAFLIVVTLPFVIDRIYSSVTLNNQKDFLRKDIESVISNMVILIFTMNFSVGNYSLLFIDIISNFSRELSTYSFYHLDDFVVNLIIK
jgi:hypothetical protein